MKLIKIRLPFRIILKNLLKRIKNISHTLHSACLEYVNSWNFLFANISSEDCDRHRLISTIFRLINILVLFYRGFPEILRSISFNDIQKMLASMQLSLITYPCETCRLQ